MADTARHFAEPFPRDPGPNERQLDAQGLSLDPPRAGSIAPDAVLVAMHLENAIACAVHGTKGEFRRDRVR